MKRREFKNVHLRAAVWTPESKLNISRGRQKHSTLWVLTSTADQVGASSALCLLSQGRDLLGPLIHPCHGPRFRGERANSCDSCLWAWGAGDNLGTLLSHTLEWGLFLFKGHPLGWPSLEEQGLPESQSRDFQGRKGPQRLPFPIANHTAKPHHTH